MQKKHKKWILPSILLVIAVLLVGPGIFSVISYPEGYAWNQYSSPSIVALAQPGVTGEINFWNGDMLGAETVEIGEYKFITYTSDTYPILSSQLGCASLPEGQNYVQQSPPNDLDEYSCPLYRGSVLVVPEICNPQCTPAQYEYRYNLGAMQINWGTNSHGCGAYVEVYKNGALVDVIGRTLYYDPSQLASVYKTYRLSSGKEYSIGYVSSALHNDEFIGSGQVCYAILNKFSLKLPEGSINISTSPLQGNYRQGQTATAQVFVNNSFVPLVGQVGARFCQPTFGQEHCETFYSKANLPLGETVVSFDIPTAYAVEGLKVSPDVRIYVDMNSFNLKGVNLLAQNAYNSDFSANYKTFTGKDQLSVDVAKSSGYSLYYIGGTIGDKREIVISPIVQPAGEGGDMFSRLASFFSSFMVWLSPLFDTLSHLSTYHWDAMFSGNVTWTDQGRYGNAVKLDGITSGSYLKTISSLELSDFPQGVTYSYWLKPATYYSWSKWSYLIAHQNSNYYSYMSKTGTIYCLMRTNTSSQITVIAPDVAPVNSWTHVACVWNGTHAIAYTNGHASNPQAMSGLSNILGAVYIGASSSASTNYIFNGTIDSVRIWNIPLNQSDIVSEMNSPVPVITSGLMADWEFEEGVGTIAKDTHPIKIV